MSFTPRTRLVNPRLGTYFGIFSSALICLVIVLLICEQLGVSNAIVRWSMLLGPLVLFLSFGLLSYTSEPLEYYASGRRVPAAYSGLGLALTALGATGLAGMAGLMFGIGYDAVCIISGGIAGFVVMAVLLAPFLRKFGTFTLPSYLGRRFDSRVLRLISAGLLSVPMFLLLVAELRIGAQAASWLVGQPQSVVTIILVAFLIAFLILGGVRSLTWTNVAMGIAVFAAVLTPITIVAVLLGYLPVPQFSGGPVLRAVGKIEQVQAFAASPPGLFDILIPQAGLQAAAKPFEAPFWAIGPGAYIAMTITVMMGIAAAPWLLPRVATAPGVYEARKSLGWATFFFGLMMLSIATIAIFMRHYLVEIVSFPLSEVPEWVTALSSQGLAEIATRSTLINLTSVKFDRDAIVYALPIAAQLPETFSYFAAAGLIAASFAAGGATAVTLANQLTEDVVYGLSWEPSAAGIRLGMSRFLLIGVVSFSGLVAAGLQFDPLKLLFWALTLTGATAFPVLVASIWWKRINAFGAAAGVVTGFFVALMVIASHALGIISLDGTLAGIIAVPASTIAAVSVSLLTPKPSKHLLELVRDIRVPGGEILYDREMRLLRLKRRQAL